MAKRNRSHRDCEITTAKRDYNQRGPRPLLAGTLWPDFSFDEERLRSFARSPRIPRSFLRSVHSSIMAHDEGGNGRDLHLDVAACKIPRTQCAIRWRRRIAAATVRVLGDACRVCARSRCSIFGWVPDWTDARRKRNVAPNDAVPCVAGRQLLRFPEV